MDGEEKLKEREKQRGREISSRKPKPSTLTVLPPALLAPNIIIPLLLHSFQKGRKAPVLLLLGSPASVGGGWGPRFEKVQPGRSQRPMLIVKSLRRRSNA
eukprot:993888-Amphidinium_carterae.1